MTGLRKGTSGGFTLIELLVTLAVAAILLAVAVPSFRTFIQNAQVNNAADGFLAAIQQARSEAITRGDAVLLCRTANPASDDCGTSDAEDWSPGWLMYAVRDFAGVGVNYDNTDDDHELISRGKPAPGGVAITSDDDGDTHLSFGGDGSLRGDNVAFAICDAERGEEEGKLIVIRGIGRPYLTDDMTDAPNCEPV